MIPQLLAQNRMKHMGGSMVALDVPTTLCVDSSQGWVAYAHRTAGDRADVRDQPRHATARIADFDGPHRLIDIFGEVVNFARVTHLTTTFNIEGGLRQDNFHLVAHL